MCACLWHLVCAAAEEYLFARCLLAAALRQAPLPVSSRHRGIPRFSPTLSGCISTAETAQDARVGRRRWDIWFITLNVHSRPCDQTGNPILHHPRPLASFQPLSWESAGVTEAGCFAGSGEIEVLARLKIEKNP